MVNFDPYYQYLYALRHDEAVKLPNGSWESDGGTWVFWGICREETNGKGSTIPAENGKFLVFSSLIQLPAGTPRIDEGTEILITRESVNLSSLYSPDFVREGKSTGLIVASGVCLKYDFGRLHCRMWI
jgi:hypothetical protein